MIIFLYGGDSFRSRQKLNEFKEKYQKEIDRDGNSLVKIAGEKTSLEEINRYISAPSLFTRKRMIIIENIFLNSQSILDAIYEYLKTKKNSEIIKENIIIFWDETDGKNEKQNKLFRLLKQEKLVQEFKPLNNNEVSAWIRNKFKKLDINIHNQDAMRLAAFFGSDLWQINNEINKLANYKKALLKNEIKAGELIQVNAADIDEMVRGNADENIFAFTDAISNKNKALALQLFENEIKSGVTETYLLHMIIRQFKILLQIREALDQGLSIRQINNLMKLHPFVMQKSQAQVRKFGTDSIKNIFNALVKIDQSIKTGRADFKSALSLLIACI